MAKVTLTDLVSSFLSKSGLNNNFQQIEDELNTKVLYRDNPAGEPNHLETSLDLNSNRIINLGAPVNNSDAVRLIDHTQFQATLDTLKDETEGFRDEAETFKNEASNSASSSSASASASASSAIDSANSASLSEDAKVDAQAAEQSAEQTVQEFNAGFTGFDEASAYDFGLVTQTNTFFNRNFGSIV